VDSNLASFGLPLQAELNERFLLHAPNADDLFAVLNTSFDTTYSRGGLFGKGIYFAEDPAKSDQYASPVHVESELSQRLGLNRESILKVLRQNAAVSEKSIAKEDSRYKQDNDFDIFFMFVCRVPLGICAEPDGIDEFNTNALPWGDEWAHSKKDVPLFEDVAVKFNLEANRYTRQDMRFAEKLSAPYTSVSVKGKFLRYREFMVYQNTVARVSHVIAYSRAREVEKEPAADSTTEKPSYKFPDYIYKKYLQDDGTLGFNGAYSDPFGDGEEID
jgi:hypothetical protein